MNESYIFINIIKSYYTTLIQTTQIHLQEFLWSIHKGTLASTVANDTSLCLTIWFGFLNFIPVDQAEMSHMNRQQNSTR